MVKSSHYDGDLPWVSFNALTATAKEYPTVTTATGSHNGHWSYAESNGNTQQGLKSYTFTGSNRFGAVWIGSDYQPSAACNYHAPAGTGWDTGLGDRTHGVSSTCSTWVR